MKKFILAFVALLLSVSVMCAKTYTVTANKLNVRDTPSTTGKILGSLEKGLEVEVIDFSEGFAQLEFFGKIGYVNAKYLKLRKDVPPQAEQSAAVAETAPKEAAAPVKERARETAIAYPVEEQAKETAIVYFFFDAFAGWANFPVMINGRDAFTMKGEEKNHKSKLKMTVHGEGKMDISYDVEFGGNRYFGQLPISVTDGGVYYVRIFVENMAKAILKKRHGWEIEQLKPKDGIKMLQKKGFTAMPDVEFDL